MVLKLGLSKGSFKIHVGHEIYGHTPLSFMYRRNQFSNSFLIQYLKFSFKYSIEKYNIKVIYDNHVIKKKLIKSLFLHIITK